MEKCQTCPPDALNLNLCEKCHTGFYPMENDVIFKGKYFECYKEIHAYYLDENAHIFKKCYESCETCNKGGNNINHNCITCKSDYQYILNLTNYINCYHSCTEDPVPYYQFRHECYKECPSGISIKSETKEYYCEAVCPKELPYEMIETQNCVDKCSIDEREKKLCIINYVSKEEGENDKEAEEKAVENVKEELTNNFNTSNVDKGKNVVIEQKGSTITITTSP